MTHRIAPDLEALAVPVTNLVEMPGNPRRGDVEAIARSFRVFGQRKPLVARKTGTDEHGSPVGYVVAGNHGLKAARDELEWSHVAVVWVDEDETTSMAFALADNRTADLGDYDRELLLAQLSEVAANATEELFAATAWSQDDLAAMLRPATPITEDEPSIPPLPTDPITRAGDLWRLGHHTLMCGDSRNAVDVDTLIGEDVINLAFTSPPYADRRQYDETSGFEPVPPERYVEWFAPVAANVGAHLADDGSWFVNIKPGAEDLDTHLYVIDLVAAHVRLWDWHFATEFCWERNGIPKHVHMRFKNQFEPIYQFVRHRWKVRPDNVAHRSANAIISLGPGSGTTTWTDKQGTGQNLISSQRRQARKSTLTPGALSAFQGNPDEGARIRGEWRERRKGHSGPMMNAQGTNVAAGEYVGEGWAYPGNRLPPFAGDHEATGHAAAFPVGLPQWFILAFTDTWDRVYDPFAGSGSTLLAAQRTNRVSYHMEISPKYCDVICRRWQQQTEQLPERDGEEVDFLANQPTPAA